MDKVTEEISIYLDNLDNIDDYKKLSLRDKIKHLFDLRNYVLSCIKINTSGKGKVKVFVNNQNK